MQSDLIHRRIRRLSEESQIPVYTYAQDYAASGGSVPRHHAARVMLSYACLQLPVSDAGQ